MAPDVSLWTRFTHRLNTLIWKLPLPNRVLVRLSETVYHNPPILGHHVAEIIKTLEQAGVIAACAGGWGVDALAGKQLRIHRDLDAVIDVNQLDEATAALATLGYEEWYRITEPYPFGESGLQISTSVIYRDRSMRVVDLMLFETPGEVLDFVQGSISGQPVTCLSPDDQVRGHLGLSVRRYRKDRQVIYRLLDSAAELKEAEKKPG
jgi:lincosamide nucleotidyltransferase A/C/D/E